VRRVSIALALAALSVALAAGATAARHATPTLKLKSAKFAGRWHASRYSGRLVLRGTAGAAMQLHVGWFRKELLGLRKPKYGPGGPFTASVNGKKGTFRKKIRLPRGLFPGKYLFLGYGQAGATIISIPQRYVTLGAPPEGVVGRAYASRTRSGSPTKRVPATARAVYFQYYMASPPRGPGTGAVPSAPPGEPRGFCPLGDVSFISGGGFGFVVKLAAGHTVTRGGKRKCVATNARLHRGIWSSRLEWNDRTLARVSVRVG
jgi:hypothetical protein